MSRKPRAATASPAIGPTTKAWSRVPSARSSTPEAILFTGSGSEANNLALRGAVLAARIDRPHVITQATEHPAVLATCRSLQRLQGVDVTYLSG